MNCFAFLVHPLALNHYFQTLNFGTSILAKCIPPYTVKKILFRAPAYLLLHIKNIRSKIGTKIEGYIIMCPLLPEQLVSNPNEAIDKILSACKLAQRLGAKIIGLGGFTSIISRGGLDLLTGSKIVITSGNTFTASLVVDSILKLNSCYAHKKNIKLAIIGASGDIGSACALYLSHYFPRLILVGRDTVKLNLLAERIKVKRTDIDLEVTTQIPNAIKNSDLIITATSATGSIIEPEHLKVGAIFCDVSYPANIDRKLVSKRKDVTIFEGGMAKCICFEGCGQYVIGKINLFNPPGLIHGCFAETMLLTFESRFENYSIGKGNITIEKMKETLTMGIKHGFDTYHPIETFN